jgi:hypothetical protein
MTAIEPERVLESVEAFAGPLIATVDEPAMGLQQDRRSEIAVRVPPVARAGGRAAEAEDALPRPVELGALFGRLVALAVWGRLIRLQPGLDQLVLCVQSGEVGHEILQHPHVRQRRDPGRPFLQAVDRRETGERVDPVIFIAQEPHTPSRQDRRKDNVGSIWSLILTNASRTIGPQ